MLVYLIRHGETTGDVEDRYGGDYDDHLSEKGNLQAKELARKLKEKNIEVLFHSPLIRAKETASIVASVTNVPLLQVPDIKERNQYGVLTGKIKAHAQKTHATEVAKLAVHPYRNAVTNSESYDLFVERVTKAFTGILVTKKETIAILTHGGIIKALFREVFKFGEFKKLGDCAVIVVRVEQGKYTLVSMDGAELLA